jgi:uncharacterized membrane protein
MKSNIRMLIAAILVVAVDSFYLKIVKGHWENQVKAVQKNAMQINLTGAALSYIFIIFALNYFILRKNASVGDAFLLGLAIYGIFEFTNMAIFKEWQLYTVITDTLWGGALFAIVTYLTYLLEKII